LDEEIRGLTKEELEQLLDGECPNCGGEEVEVVPWAILVQTFRCPECLTIYLGFNKN